MKLQHLMTEADKWYLYGRGEAHYIKMMDEQDTEMIDEDWITVKAPVSRKWYSLNIWLDDEAEEVHCTAYDVDDNNTFETDLNDWVRLW